MSTRKVAVITGGHPFDVQPFHHLFEQLPGIKAYIQHTDEFTSSPQEVRDGYDALVFYGMLKDTPTNEAPWYARKPLAALERLGQTHQGIVVLHHALLAYPDWPVWDEIAGVQARIMRSYHPGESLGVQVAAPEHPICQGVSDFEMVDETYMMDVKPDAVEGNQVVLTTQHPRSIRSLGWARTYQNARVFCFASGHGEATYANPGFQRVLANGILFVAEQ